MPPSLPTDASVGARVLIAEDDLRVREAVARALELEGYEVQAVADGAAALEIIDGDTIPDLVILDIMMGPVDGLTACRRMRDRGLQLPILMLTARHELGDRVAGLDAGADDYLVKPFELDELLARLRALLRRNGGAATSQIVCGDLVLDHGRRSVARAGSPIELTKTEFDLLALLMEHENMVLTREVLYERVWGYDFETGSKSLDVYVGYLRRKTEGEDGELGPRLIHTVRGVGYTLRAP